MIFFRNADLTSLRGLPLLFAVLMAVALSALGQSSAADKSETQTVHGTVINSVTQAPIPRALVMTPDNRFATLSDGDGHFEITLPKLNGNNGMVYSGPANFGTPRVFSTHGGQTFFLMARKPGFFDDGRGKPNIPSSGDDDIKIALSPEAIIKGRIAIASGDAALGINVQLYFRQVMDGLPHWTQGPTVRANSSGEFRFAELQPGAYRLVTHEFMDNDPITNIPGSQVYGYPPMYYPGASDFSSASTIQLSAGQEFEADLSLARQPYFPVRIPIANAEGIGSLDVSVQGQRGPGYALGYNASEQRVEGLLPNGNYVVEASTFGRDVGHTPLSGSVALRVTGGPADGPSMALVPTSSIKLNVKEEFTDTSWNGSSSWNIGGKTFPVHGPRVYLNANMESADDFAQPRGGSIRPPQGPNDDTLVFENLSPGRYWVRLNTGRGYVASATQGATDVLHQPLTVGSGPAAPIEVTLRDDTAELDGTVTVLAQQAGLSADAPQPATVWIYAVPLPDSAGQFTQFGVGGDGKFTNPRMAPGDYRILAFHQDHPQLPYRDAEAMKAYESKGQVVHLTGGQKTTVQVQTILNE